MTPAEKYAFIKNNVLRRAFRRWPSYSECLRNARVDGLVENVKGQLTIRRVFYRCAECGELYPRKHVNVDHIENVVGVDGWDGDWNKIVEGMYCDVEGLQVLCAYYLKDAPPGKPSCHYLKSQAERKARPKKPKKVRKAG